MTSQLQTRLNSFNAVLKTLKRIDGQFHLAINDSHKELQMAKQGQSEVRQREMVKEYYDSVPGVIAARMAITMENAQGTDRQLALDNAKKLLDKQLLKLKETHSKCLEKVLRRIVSHAFIW